MPEKLILGRYRPVSRIGSGGFAEVSLAWDTRLQRRVAIKSLKLDEETAAMVEGADDVSAYDLDRIPGLAEARTAAMFQDPNIAGVLDFGVKDGFAYFIMEYVDGITLADLLAEFQDYITLDVVAAVFAGVAHALDVAHANHQHIGAIDGFHRSQIAPQAAALLIAILCQPLLEAQQYAEHVLGDGQTVGAGGLADANAAFRRAESQRVAHAGRIELIQPQVLRLLQPRSGQIAHDDLRSGNFLVRRLAGKAPLALRRTLFEEPSMLAGNFHGYENIRHEIQPPFYPF